MNADGIFRGIIVEQVDNKYRVRIPERHGVAGSANSWPNSELPLYSVSTLSGIESPYLAGDVVCIDYVDDNDPIIIGKLLGGKDSASATLKVKHLTVSETATLPASTSIGDVTPAQLLMLQGVKKNIQTQINDICTGSAEYLLKYQISDFSHTQSPFVDIKGPVYKAGIYDGDTPADVELTTSGPDSILGNGNDDANYRLNWLGAMRVENNRVGIATGLYSRYYPELSEYTWRPTIQGYTSRFELAQVPPINYIQTVPAGGQEVPVYDSGRYPYALHINPDGGDVIIGRGGYFRFIDHDKRTGNDFNVITDDETHESTAERECGFYIGGSKITSVGSTIAIDGIEFDDSLIRIGGVEVSPTGLTYSCDEGEVNVGADGVVVGNTHIKSSDVYIVNPESPNEKVARFTDEQISVGTAKVSPTEISLDANTYVKPNEVKTGSTTVNSSGINANGTTVSLTGIRVPSGPQITVANGVVVGDTKVTGSQVSVGADGNATVISNTSVSVPNGPVLNQDGIAVGQTTRVTSSGIVAGAAEIDSAGLTVGADTKITTAGIEAGGAVINSTDGVKVGTTYVKSDSISAGGATINSNGVAVGQTAVTPTGITAGSAIINSDGVSVGDTSISDSGVTVGSGVNAISVNSSGVQVGTTVGVTVNGVTIPGASLANGKLTLGGVSIVKGPDNQFYYANASGQPTGNPLGSTITENNISNFYNQYLVDNSFVSIGSANSGNDSFVYMQMYYISESSDSFIKLCNVRTQEVSDSISRENIFRHFTLNGVEYRYKSNAFNSFEDSSPTLIETVYEGPTSTSGVNLYSFVSVGGETYKIDIDPAGWQRYNSATSTFESTVAYIANTSNKFIKVTDVRDSSISYVYYIDGLSVYNTKVVASASSTPNVTVDGKIYERSSLTATVAEHALVIDDTVYTIDALNDIVKRNGKKVTELNLPSFTALVEGEYRVFTIDSSSNVPNDLATAIQTQYAYVKYAVPYLPYSSESDFPAEQTREMRCFGLYNDYSFDMDGGEAFYSGFVVLTTYFKLTAVVDGNTVVRPVCAQQRIQMSAFKPSAGSTVSSQIELDMVANVNISYDTLLIHFYLRAQADLSKFNATKDEFIIKILNIGNAIVEINMNNDDIIRFNKLYLAQNDTRASFNAGMYYEGINIAGITASAIQTNSGTSDNS